jgi:phosphoenolpyruvate synthase/pyruvate phosphate dikinase
VFQGDFPLLDELFGDVATKVEKSDLSYGSFAMSEPFIAEGKQAENSIDQLNSRLNFMIKTDVGTFNGIQGVTAYYDASESIVIGNVKVIRNPKTERFETGFILVAPSTTPDYMDAIRRCKAIITDWGGQTSHAAIVSRELKKPCIIGTNYASQILQNGEKVRLDLRSGRVEVISSG